MDVANIKKGTLEVTNVEILTRNINGNKMLYVMEMDEVCSFVANNNAILEDEILLVCLNARILYSSLTSPAITWEDITGFFA